MQRDSLDLTSTDVTRQFKRMFFPTVLGMLSIVALNIADGIFVGRGIGSNALAAVNIAAPLFMIAAGINLLFGVGASVVASVHLSQGRIKAANINITQAFIMSLSLIALMISCVAIWTKQTAHLLGSSEILLPGVMEYLHWILPGLVMSCMSGVGMFVIRLDGSPRYAMMCNVIPAGINILLDYIFVFPLDMGLKGAAVATSISFSSGALMAVLYFVKFHKILHIYRLKFSVKSLKLTIRNVGYMAKIGSSSMLGEVAIASMMLVGNYMFMKILAEDGVAAYSVLCYCFPIVFMVSNAIAQSAQPLLSYNYGIGREKYVIKTFLLSLKVAAAVGVVIFGAIYTFCPALVALFLDPDCAAYKIAVDGIPYFTFGIIFFVLNIAWIGFFQSIEMSRRATIFMILRGIILMSICFVTLPIFLGERGLWLAIPAAELTVFVMLTIDHFIMRKKRMRLAMR